MKDATLGVVLEGDTMLLGEKKKGEIGTGVLSGPGGKLDPGETREELEIELDPASLEPVALIDFYAGGNVDFRVHVYRARIASGELRETADMIPAWYPVNDLPYDRMYESDRHWIGKAAQGEKFRANVYYRDRAKDFDRIEFLPLD